MKTCLNNSILVLIILLSVQLQAQYNAGVGSGTVGAYHTFVGVNAGQVNTGGYNSFFGRNAGYVNTTGGFNCFIGSGSGRYNNTGKRNTFLGFASGNQNTTGSYNTFLGNIAGYDNTTGSYNNFIGYSAGRFNKTGTRNLFNGSFAGFANTSGKRNIFMGYATGYDNTTGSYNSFIGYAAGRFNKTGQLNTMLGYYAGYNATGSGNVFIGSKAGFNEMGSNKLYIDNSTTSNPLIKGDFNSNSLTFNGTVGVGASTPSGNDIQLFVDGRFSQLVNGTFGGFASGDRWSSLGDSPVSSIYGLFNQGYGASFVSGSKNGTNNIIGFSGNRLDFDRIGTGGSTQTLVSIIKNNGRVGIGTTSPMHKLQVNVTGRDGLLLTGNDEGDVILQISNGATNHYIFDDDDNGHTLDIESGNDLAFSTNGASEKMRIKENGNVGIGTTNPGSYKLFVAGTAYATGSWVSSDKRYKKDIKTIDNALDKINAIDGVSYQFKKETVNDIDFSEMKNGNHLGFIAHDLEKVFPELVQQDEKGYYAVNYDGLVPVLVQAMKDQQELIDSQEEEIKGQNEEITVLKARLDKLENAFNTLIDKSTSNTQSKLTIPTEDKVTEDIVLRQNRPNPFDRTTLIEYQIPEKIGNASLIIYDLNGKVLSTNQVSGNGSFEFDSSGLSNGVYIYAIFVKDKRITANKMIIQR